MVETPLTDTGAFAISIDADRAIAAHPNQFHRRLEELLLGVLSCLIATLILDRSVYVKCFYFHTKI